MDLERARSEVGYFAEALVGQPAWDHQAEVLRSPARIRCLVAGRQSGKSRTLRAADRLADQLWADLGQTPKGRVQLAAMIAAAERGRHDLAAIWAAEADEDESRGHGGHRRRLCGKGAGQSG